MSSNVKAQSLRTLFDSIGDKEFRKDLLSKGTMFYVKRELLIEDEGYNTRDYDTERVQKKIREYAEGFKRGDIFPPLHVKVVDGTIYIRDGYLRSRGAALAVAEGAEVDRLPVVEVSGDEAAQDLVILKSNDGLKLLPLERAAVYIRMHKVRGLSADEIAEIDSRTAASIRQYLDAWELPLELKRLINSDQMSMTTANSLFKEHGHDAVKLVKDIIQRNPKNNTDGKGIRVTKRQVERVTGYRTRFSPTLVREITDGFRALSFTLSEAKPSSSGFFEVKLTPHQMEQLQKLASEVEPKPDAAQMPASEKGMDGQMDMDDFLSDTPQN